MIDPALPADFFATIRDLERRITAMERAQVNYSASSSHLLVPSYGIPDTTRQDGFMMSSSLTGWKNIYTGTVALSARNLRVPFNYDTGFITGSSITMEFRLDAFAPDHLGATPGTIYSAVGLTGVSQVNALVDLKDTLGIERGRVLLQAYMRVLGTGVGGTARWRLDHIYSSTVTG